MIAHLTGRVTAVSDIAAVIEVAGIGYRVHVPVTVLRSLTPGEGPVTLHTHLAVREDALTLYGFLDPAELSMFKVLIGVNRVGPQLALNILSVLSVGELASAVAGDDEKVLTRCPGIGMKNAKRLILELKDRMKGMETGSGPAPVGTVPAREDAISGLVSLGFDPREARTAVEAAAAGEEEADAPVLLRAALARLKGG